MSAHNDNDNAELARACAQRPPNQEAWEELLRRFGALVDWKAATILRSQGKHVTSQTIEDIAQEVFEKLYLRLPTFDEERSTLSAFIMLLAKTTTLDNARRLRRHDRLVSLDDAQGIAERLELGTIDTGVLVDLVYQVARSVTNQRDRKLLIDFLNGASEQELSTRYQISRATVYRIIHEYKEQLRTALGGLP
jgi:RNA polymerase sigma factor (sigma-70 family)